MADDHGLAVEQSFVDVLYGRLDTLRDEAAERLAAVRREGPSGSPQNRSERDAFATLYEDRIAQLDAVEDRLCFGRLDLVDGDPLYVGRVGLSDAEHVPLLTDWRAPAARAFYSATAANPGGVVNRRHITTVGRRVAAVEDDVLDVEALGDRGDMLAGEGALLAALGARRTGKMTDIVATIQAEQDAVIRAPREGALVVQGGPGTGKTAVALHRAAFLLYQHREQLERSGVLLIGPSRSFLAYIDKVLPSLGETGAVSTTLAGLVPGVTASAREDDAVAEIKGRAGMAQVIKAAVRERQRLPERDQEVSIDGRPIVIRRSDIRDAQARARREGRPHNAARATFAKDMVARLTAQLVEQLGENVDEDDRNELQRDVRDSREVRVALNLAWLPLTPEHLLRDLFARPELLEHAAPRLAPSERTLLLRSPDSPLTDADVPLLDEAAELLGDMPGTRRNRDADISKEELDYAKQVIANVGARGMVSADDLARRMAGSASRETVAERAAKDRAWTYGHVVVDEAQEVSPMGWRMLLRRCPSRSFTIVGDVAQTSAPTGTRWWPEAMDPLFGQNWTLRELTVSYRIPAEVAQTAQSFARAAGLPASDLTAARSSEGAVTFLHADGEEAGLEAVRRAVGAAATRFEEDGAGVSAVIAPEHRLAWWADRLGGADGASVVSAREAKGLEYDTVVVVDPHEFSRASDLFVALTRPTSELVVVATAGLPQGLTEPDQTSRV